MLKTSLIVLLILLGLLLISAAIYTAYNVRRIERTFPAAGQFIEVDGLRLDYVYSVFLC